MADSPNNDHTLLARVDENVINIRSALDGICEIQAQHAERLRHLEIAQAETNVKIGIGATLSGLAAAIVGVFVQKP